MLEDFPVCVLADIEESNASTDFADYADKIRMYVDGLRYIPAPPLICVNLCNLRMDWYWPSPDLQLLSKTKAGRISWQGGQMATGKPPAVIVDIAWHQFSRLR